MTYTVSPSHPLRRLSAYARDYRGRIWAASTYSVLNKLFALAPEGEFPSGPKPVSQQHSL